MNLYEKLLKITEEAQQIEKKGYNSFSNYKYIRAIDVIAEIQKLLVKNKVYISVSELGYTRAREESKKGSQFHSTLNCKATFINAEKPDEKFETEYFSVSADTLDKDIFKAKTNGLKYLLTQQFMLVTDVLIDTEDDKKQSNKSTSAPQKDTREIYGYCDCGGNLHLAASKKGLYCADFKNETKKHSPYTKYTGQKPVKAFEELEVKDILPF